MTSTISVTKCTIQGFVKIYFSKKLKETLSGGKNKCDYHVFKIITLFLCLIIKANWKYLTLQKFMN